MNRGTDAFKKSRRRVKGHWPSPNFLGQIPTAEKLHHDKRNDSIAARVGGWNFQVGISQARSNLNDMLVRAKVSGDPRLFQELLRPIRGHDDVEDRNLDRNT